MIRRHKIIGIAAIVMILITPTATLALTNVSIVYNEKYQGSVLLDTSKIVYKSINIEHNESDFAWNRVKIAINVISRSTVKEIKRIYLYKCIDKHTISPKLLTPIECIRNVDPVKFDTYIDTELSWSDISVPTTPSFYPEESIILMFVKLEGFEEENPVWLLFLDKIVRTDFNKFDIYSYDIEHIDFYAKTDGLADTIKAFIENYQMIPSSWAEKIVFTTAKSITGFGVDKDGMENEPITFSVVQPSTKEIRKISKDYFFIIPETTSGTGNGITLILNPTFDCGNGNCESWLGESYNNCCYDCGCPDGYYCNIDIAQTGQTGVCRDESEIFLEVEPIDVVQVSDCEQSINIYLKISVKNPPSGLENNVYGTVNIGSYVENINCDYIGNNIYSCPLNIEPPIFCGVGDERIDTGSIILDIVFADGQNMKTKTLTANIPEFVIEYNCPCDEGMYCDSVSKTCEPIDISLEIISSDSVLTNFIGSGDIAEVEVEITNPPGDLNIEGFSFSIGSVEYDGESINGYSDDLECTESGEYQYTCKLPINIDNYNNQRVYILRDIIIKASVNFLDGNTLREMILYADVPEITIPSVICGDGIVSVGETEETCCIDTGCEDENKYCDLSGKCKSLNDVFLNVVDVKEENVTDCYEEHIIKIKAKIENLPTDASLDDYAHMIDDEISEYSIECDGPKRSTGIVNCVLTIPPMDECFSPYVLIGPNTLKIDISFPDGEDIISKELSSSFSNIHIIPIYHPGNGICESDFGENASNNCVDCPCEMDPLFGEDYYCNFDPEKNPNGTCLLLHNITLVVESPTSDVDLGPCDMPEDFEVKLYIENEPEGMYLENYIVTINGKTSDYITCEEDIYSIYGRGKKKYICTISLIPEEEECITKNEIIYGDNSISFFISFNNGLDTELWTLTSDLPNIRFQGIQERGLEEGEPPKPIHKVPTPPKRIETFKTNIERLLKNIESKKVELNESIRKLKSNAWHCRNNLNLVSLFWEFGEFSIAALSGNPIGYLKHIFFSATFSAQAPLLNPDAQNKAWSGFTKFYDKVFAETFSKWIGKDLSIGETVGKDVNIEPSEVDAMLAVTDLIGRAWRSSWNSACKRAEINADIAEKYYTQQLDVILKAEICIANWQMQIDSGYCSGQEYYCFQEMVKCWDDAIEKLENIQEGINENAERLYDEWLKEEREKWRAGGGVEVELNIDISCGGENGRCCGVELLPEKYRDIKFDKLRNEYPDVISTLKRYDYKWYQYNNISGSWFRDENGNMIMIDYDSLPIRYIPKDNFVIDVINGVCSDGKLIARLGDNEMEISLGENKININWFIDISIQKNNLLNFLCKNGLETVIQSYPVCFCPGDLRYGCIEEICEEFWKECKVAEFPDLVVEISGVEKNRLTFYVKNKGSYKAGRFNIVLYKIKETGGFEKVYETVGNDLEAGESLKFDVISEFDKKDKFIIILDPENIVREIDENNNCLFIDILTNKSDIPTNCREFTEEIGKYENIISRITIERYPPCKFYGDVDGDGFVTYNDADRVMEIWRGDVPTDLEMERGDVNGDGKLDSEDAVEIYAYADGIIYTFEVCRDLPDLEVYDLKIEKGRGNFYTITWLVRNSGKDVNKEFNTVLIVNGKSVCDFWFTDGLKSNMVKEKQCYRELNTGDVVNVVVDGENVILESDETNNKIVKTLI